MTTETLTRTDRTEELASRVRSRLTPDRWNHTLGVAQMVERLAEIYGDTVEPDRHVEVALLHDNARDLPDEQQKRLAGEYLDGLDEIERRFSALWHAPAGAQFMVEELSYEPTDPRTTAVAYHSTGHPELSNELKYLLVADFTEVNRSHETANNLRSMIGEVPLKELCRRVLQEKIKYCFDRNKPVHPRTLKTYNTLCD